MDNTVHVRPGWHQLVRLLDAEAEQRGVQVLQVKEKFGGLRYYTAAIDLDLDALIQAAELLSNYLCEECGAPGRHVSPRGWIHTLCPTHSNEDS